MSSMNMKEFFHYCSLIIVELLTQSQKKILFNILMKKIQKIQLIQRSSYLILMRLLVESIRIDKFLVQIWVQTKKPAVPLEVSRSPFLRVLLLGANSISYINKRKRNKIFCVFCWSGDTRIWTGEKGFAVPRLTTRPCRQSNAK